MAVTEASLLRQCPLLLPQNRSKTVYEGFISAQEVALKNRQELYALPPPPQFYSSLIEEIGTLGWDKLVYADTCFSTIKLKAEDASGREHLITLKLKAKYPAESPDYFVDFPVPFCASWTPQVTDQAKMDVKIAVLPVSVPLSAGLVKYSCHGQLESSGSVWCSK
uniref:FA complementation group L n=1 Tax=Homo sapiens TaxID=9606 RepID=A0A8Q3WMD3_HUMAN